MKTFKFIKISLAILSLTGLTVSYMLLQEHHFSEAQKKTGQIYNTLSSISQTLCGEEGAFLDCSKVAASEYSSVSGIPLALGGIVFFTMSLLLSLLIIFASDTRASLYRTTLFIMHLGASAASIILLAISLVKIKAVCPLCSVVYMCIWVSLGLMFTLFSKLKLKPSEELIRLLKNPAILFSKDNQIHSALITVFIIIAIAAGTFTNRNMTLSSKKFISAMEIKKFSEIAIQVYKSRPIIFETDPIFISGSPDAQVVITKFSDFMCPACARTGLWLENYTAKRSESVSLVFYNFPLDKDCNPIMRNQLHQGACLVHKGAVCADKQGAFHRYYNAAFSTRNIFVPEEIAQRASLNMEKFKTCMASREPADIVKQNIEEGMKHGVTSTPSIFINGKRYQGPLKEEILDQIIEMEINSKIQKMDGSR